MRRTEANREIVHWVAGMAMLGLLWAGGCGTPSTPPEAPSTAGPASAAGSAPVEPGPQASTPEPPAAQPPAGAADQADASTSVEDGRDFPLPNVDSAATSVEVEAGGAEPAGSADAAGLADEEPLFVDWPQPALALVFTGLQSGFFEPCGCSGLENQKGGLIRRFSLLEQLAGRNWPVVPIDVGNQVRRFGRQSEIKFQVTVEGLRNMAYRAIGFGPDDLRLPAPELVAVVAPTGNEPSRFVAANVTILDPSFTSPYLILEEQGKRIGVTMVLGERELQQVNNAEVTSRDAAEAIREVWPAMEQAACDLNVLVAHASIEESVALARQFPQFTLVVTAGGAGEPTREPVTIDGTSVQMIEVGTKGMYASVIGLYDDPAHRLRYQRVPLDARFPDAVEGLQLLAAYQDQIREAGFEGLGIRPQPHPSGREYIGSVACAECHSDAWEVWKEGLDGYPPKHSRAYATLQQPPGRADIPRNFDPECLSCHVVGWNPQKHFPYRTGYLSVEETPDLINVGCEDCHGPGKQHADAENGVVELEEEEMELLRQELVVKLEEAERKCLECHDLDNSPDFQEEGAFEKYWAKIEH